MPRRSPTRRDDDDPGGGTGRDDQFARCLEAAGGLELRELGLDLAPRDLAL